ncbi:response regulator [uncultured Nostoc sp.]|uniref:response regulator n=1 Tax=uncultured Nostoc sp. TaxID=340711 RepID=UPI0035C961B2
MTHNTPFVLIVADDNPDDRLLLQTAWEETAPVFLYLVEDGQELMDLLYRQGKYTGTEVIIYPDLILVDLKMPRKNGHEALAEIKTHPELSKIPVVILTTSNAESDVARSYKLGANACMTKPESFENLLQLVQTLYQTWLKL